MQISTLLEIVASPSFYFLLVSNENMTSMPVGVGYGEVVFVPLRAQEHHLLGVRETAHQSIYFLDDSAPWWKSLVLSFFPVLTLDIAIHQSGVVLSTTSCDPCRFKPSCPGGPAVGHH